MQDLDNTDSTMQCTCTFAEINIEKTTPCPVFNQSQCFSCSVANYSVNCNVIDYQTGNHICLVPKDCSSIDPHQPITNAKTIVFVIVICAFCLIFAFCLILHKKGYLAFVYVCQSQSNSDEMSEQIEFVSYDTFQ